MTANDVMKTGDITKNVNEKLRIYLSFKELNECFNYFTFNSLYHSQNCSMFPLAFVAG